MADDLFIHRESLDEICSVPDKIISVYSLEKHVWADSNSEMARRDRKPELQTIEEFQIGPVRPFLNDILRNIAAPYDPKRKDNPIGQGYWVQAEFGSGKSHLLSFLASITLGDEQSWNIISEKEKKAERGRRESIYRFWEEGLKSKNSNGKKGIFVVVKTLVGSGGGAVGTTNKGKRLSEYILDTAKEQLQIETGKNISLYPVELLADRFLSEDIDRYRNDLKKFLKDPNFFNQDEFEEADTFINDIQQNKTPDYKRSCGNKLWRFYTEYLKVHPQIAAETEDILKYMVETILAEGYSGVLLVLDEVSLFMKDRDDDQRVDDEKTLVVLANRLAKIHNLPIWTVCAAQQAIESKMGVKNIIAEDRLKLVKLLEEDRDYYDIVLARVREIVNPTYIGKYYLYYKRGFSWPNTISEDEFRHFFPFHKPALEVLRAVTYELTTTRSAIHFMHQTLKHQIKDKGCELIRLWELFDEAVNYEEDPSGVHAGIAAIKTQKESDYRAYESCKRQIDGLTKGYLKVHRDKAIKIIQTLFLYHISRTRQQGITTEEIANSVLIERVKLGIRMKASGKEFIPKLPDAERIQRISLPSIPSVGEVIGLAIAGDHGCILHFEMQATKGSGRIVPLGSIQKVMRESIEAAAQYVKARHADLGISAEWRQNYDVAILATFMGVPKEGPSAGITIVTGIVSALKSVPVRNDIAMTGEITIMGKVLPVGGIQQKIRAAYDAGIKNVIIPADNLKEAQSLPSNILNEITLIPVEIIEDALKVAFI